MAISVQPSNLPIAAVTPLRSETELLPAMSSPLKSVNQQSITVVQAPAPVGYSNIELYTEFKTISTIEHPEDSILNSKLASKLSNRFQSGYAAVSGLYGQMTEALNANQSSISQTSSKTLFQTRIKDFNPAKHTERIQESRTKDVSTALTIETKEGDKLTFNIHLDYTRGQLSDNAGSYSSKNITIDMSVDGDLNRAEKKAIAEFSAALDKQLMSGDAEFDFSNVNIFSSDQISKVDFSIKNGPSSNQSFSLKMTNTSSERSIDFKAGTQKLNISLDFSDLIAGKSGQSQALKELVKSLENGLSDARQYSGKGAALIEATKAIFSNVPETNNTDTATRLGQSVTSGLPDFKIDYQNGSSVNLEVQQRTYISQENLELNVRQNYEFDLTYEYFKALPHLERPDFEYGNYIRVNGTEQQSRLSTLSTNSLGELTQASITKNAHKSHTEKTFSEGELVDTQHSEQSLSAHQDLIDEILAAEENNKLLMLDGILDHLEFDNF
ncbi:hypothetical protein [Reinekea sp.]|uniref:hypothetical protein n=2 Tax=Reinekea sp. TaxID=1970455 RepID=UPI00398A0C85